MTPVMYKLSFYAPVDQVEDVKSALFAVGAGRMGNYDSCCWQVLGQGQFRANEASQPFVGAKGVVERIPEFKVEMVVEDHLIQVALQVLRQVHPYEEPAFEYYKINS